MFELQLRDQMARVGDRLGRLWLWRRLTWCWVGCSAAALTWFGLGRPFGPVVGWVVLASGLMALMLSFSFLSSSIVIP